MPSAPLQLFKGKFFVCQGEDVRNVTNKSDCLLANYKWVRHKYNFDNLGQVRSQRAFGLKKCGILFHHFLFFPLYQALMSLFVLASKDGWVDIMYDGLDAVGVDQQVNINSYHTLTNKTPTPKVNPISQTNTVCESISTAKDYLSPNITNDPQYFLSCSQ